MLVFRAQGFKKMITWLIFPAVRVTVDWDCHLRLRQGWKVLLKSLMQFVEGLHLYWLSTGDFCSSTLRHLHVSMITHIRIPCLGNGANHNWLCLPISITLVKTFSYRHAHGLTHCIHSSIEILSLPVGLDCMSLPLLKSKNYTVDLKLGYE